MSSTGRRNSRYVCTKVFLLVLAGVLGALILGTGRAAATTVPTSFFVVPDEQGPNDQPGQVDLTVFGRDTSTPGLYNLFWDWDSVNFTGQTGDACALFDYNGNGMIDVAVCSEIQRPDQGVVTGPGSRTPPPSDAAAR
jgi:hypothetical protein